MDMTLRAATPAERLYAYDQSTQIAGQCGSPGYLRGRLDDTGTVFAKSWERDAPARNTPEFKAEFNSVLDMLRLDERYGYALKNRTTMIAYCLDHPEGRLPDCHEYVFRADTQEHSYLVRCAPNGEDHHVFIYPYHREWFDRHMKRAEKGIRFIDPNYKELFRIPDGDMVRITRSDGTHIDKVCRYIDECHLEIGHGWDSLFHICQFAEQMARCDNTVIPLRSTLPERCYSLLPSSDEIIIVRKGESGYYHTDKYGHDRTEAWRIVEEYNERDGVTKAQATAMLGGSMFGWDTPTADPKNYDGQGQPIKPKRPDRGDAR